MVQPAEYRNRGFKSEQIEPASAWLLQVACG